ncbi:EamA family transporter [Oceanospirillum sp.]|uniref:EamA family transporter n=1 Tax=Oceanospirillum sp. TaxID=2021254 RepID=UPI003A8E6042
MNPEALVLVLISACLHAGWNLIGKQQSPSQAFFVISTFFGVLLLSPWLWLNPVALPDWNHPFWLWLIFSGFFQAIYLTGLARAYKSGDLSVSYPLARALPVVFVPLCYSLSEQGSQIDSRHFPALILIVAGALLLPLNRLRDWHWRAYLQPSILFVLLAAAGTTGYSLVDAHGINILQKDVGMNPYQAGASYVLLQGMTCLLWLAPWAMFYQEERRQVFRLIQAPKWMIWAGLFIMLTYLMILASFALVDEASFVVAFRQISIVLGVIASVVLLKEQLNRLRVVSVSLIFFGVVLISL